MLFVRRPWHQQVTSFWTPMRDTKTSVSPRLHLCGTVHSHNKWSLYFLVTGLLAIHRQAQGRQQLKKKRFHLIFFSCRFSYSPSNTVSAPIKKNSILIFFGFCVFEIRRFCQPTNFFKIAQAMLGQLSVLVGWDCMHLHTGVNNDITSPVNN